MGKRRNDKGRVLFNGAAATDRKTGNRIGSFLEALQKMSCDIFIEESIPALVMKDIATGDNKYIVLENGSLVFYDTKAAACTAKESFE